MILELRKISKAFGSRFANRDIALSVEPGTIHGIIGENGAGKSTAMKIITGELRPDSGEIWFKGVRRQWSSPKDAIGAGIGMVHQHFLFAEPMTLLENLIVGHEPLVRHLAALGWVDLKAAHKELTALMERLKMPVPLDEPVEDVPLGLQQRAEILKLLYRNADLLILDEPTAVLVPHEIEGFFDVLRVLKSQGKTILLITHKLKEILAITDSVTVLRDGQVSGSKATAGLTEMALAEMIVGREVLLRVDRGVRKQAGAPILKVDHLISEAIASRRGALKDVSFEVRAGEIVGIAGIEGNGQSELLEAVSGVTPQRKSQWKLSGSVQWFGKTGLSRKSVRACGVGMIPEDRHRLGLWLERTLRENFALGDFRKRDWSRPWGWNRSGVTRATLKAMEAFDVSPRDVSLPVKALSGGNQQKFLFSRETARAPKAWVVAQPTRGVDVGAIERIHQELIHARDQGAAILLVSSELEELLALSDRILVLFEGKIVRELDGWTANEREIGYAMSGGGQT